MGILWTIIAGVGSAPSSANAAYHRAVGESDDLIRRFREAASEPRPENAVMCQVWQHRDDLPFLVQLYQEAQEAGTPRALPE